MSFGDSEQSDPSASPETSFVHVSLPDGPADDDSCSSNSSFEIIDYEEFNLPQQGQPQTRSDLPLPSNELLIVQPNKQAASSASEVCRSSPKKEPSPVLAGRTTTTKTKSWSELVQASTNGERGCSGGSSSPTSHIHITSQPKTLVYKQRPWKSPSIKVVSVAKKPAATNPNRVDADDEDIDCNEQYYSLKAGGGHSRMKSVKLRPDEQRRKDFSNEKRDMQRGYRK